MQSTFNNATTNTQGNVPLHVATSHVDANMKGTRNARHIIMSKGSRTNVKGKGKGRANKGKGKGRATNVAGDTIDVESLVDALRVANANGDRALGKKIRRKLRAGGHRGGLRGGTI
jgi:hypothetical protein